MQDASATIFAIASRYIDGVAALDPFTATGWGIAGYDHLATDFSPEAGQARSELARRTLAELEPLAAEERDGAVARAVMIDSLEGDLQAFEAGDQYFGLRPIASPVETLRTIFEQMPRDSPAAWENIARRLHALPAAARSIEALFAGGLRRGQVVARRQVEAVLHQIDVYAGRASGSTPAFADLASSLAAWPLRTPALEAELESGIAAARDCFVVLHEFLESKYLPAATEREGSGRERYRRAARRFLGLDLDLDETYAWGWDEVRRLRAEMQQTAGRIKDGATIAEAAALLDADPARILQGEAALLNWLQRFQDRAIAATNGKIVDIPERAKRLEARIAPPGGALAQYYTSPSEDFSRPGRTWYPTGGQTTFFTWRDTTTAYHEGVPGHHLQIALALHQAEHLSRFQRLAARYSGHAEGWALYAERLMAELGYLDDPGDYLGMLGGQMHRAVRVVVDLGAHLQLPIPRESWFEPGEPWTFARMCAFLQQEAQVEQAFAESEVVRYLGWPAQAISYKVGERAWLQIRDSSRQRHGDQFSLRTFHNAALGLGRMGLDLLNRTMATTY